ncbi:MAG: enoyl-CoA hydratase [Gammaproteobacteria bacterium]
MSAVADANPAAEPVLLCEQHGPVTTLTLNRPQQYNALSEQLLTALQQALDRIATDPDTRVVVLAARGKAFCPGHDLKQMRANESREYHQDLFAQCSRMMLSINQLPQPVIAKVQGIATAAGCQLVAACDLAIAVRSARFAVSGINLGLFCSTPAVALSRNLSRKQALGMLLTGDFIDAETALSYGLLNQVVADEELDAAVAAMADKICAKSALALRIGKDMFYRQLDMPLEEAYGYAGERMACNMDSADAREGIDAFLQKRQPQWQGR